MCCGIAVGVNEPNVVITTGIELLSTVTITVSNPNDVVRLMVSIESFNPNSAVNSTLVGNLLEYVIRRDSDVIRSVSDTDFDGVTTTFTALDIPGAGTFTYTLEGDITRSAAAAGTQEEDILSVVFTAEELSLTT